MKNGIAVKIPAKSQIMFLQILVLDYFLCKLLYRIIFVCNFGAYSFSFSKGLGSECKARTP